MQRFRVRDVNTVYCHFSWLSNYEVDKEVAMQILADTNAHQNEDELHVNKERCIVYAESHIALIYQMKPGMR